MPRCIWLVLLVLASGCAPDDRPSRGSAQPDAAPAAPPAPATPAPQPRAAAQSAAARPRIVFLGDSLTAGLGLSPEQTVTALIQRRLDDEDFEYEVVNAGVSGDTSAGGLSRLDWSLDGNVKVLVIELGGNDGLRGLPPSAMKANLTEIITRAKGRGITVLLTGMEAPSSHGVAYANEFRQVFRDLAREHDVAFMPFFLEGVALDPRLNQRDGIHPNPEGARVIERAVWNSLEPLLDDDKD
jgi:acyl-CoA thioesterase-1